MFFTDEDSLLAVSSLHDLVGSRNVRRAGQAPLAL